MARKEGSFPGEKKERGEGGFQGTPSAAWQAYPGMAPKKGGKRAGTRNFTDENSERIRLYLADGLTPAKILRRHPDWSYESIRTIVRRLRKSAADSTAAEAVAAEAEAAPAAAAAAAAGEADEGLPAMGSADPVPLPLPKAKAKTKAKAKAKAKAVPKLAAAAKPTPRSTARIPIGALRAKLKEEPGISLSKLAKLFKVNRYSVSKAISRHVGGKSVKKVKVHRLKVVHAERRLEWARRMRMCLDMSPYRRMSSKRMHLSLPDLSEILFSDEKLIRYAGKQPATQNARLRLEEGDTKRAAVARNPEPFLLPSSTAVSRGIMVHVIMSGHCGAERPHFVDASIKLSASTYQDLLRDYVLPHVYANAYDMDTFRFQQDGAPAHSVRSTLAWLKERGIALLPWPANSPDLSPLDFFYWGRLEQELQALYPGGFANEDELRGGVLHAAGRIPIEEMRRNIDSFYRRVGLVITHGGAQIEVVQQ